MIIKQVIDTLEELAPLNYAEIYDNVGLWWGKWQIMSKGFPCYIGNTLENVSGRAIAKSAI